MSNKYSMNINGIREQANKVLTQSQSQLCEEAIEEQG